jgi:hypothetical protein
MMASNKIASMSTVRLPSAGVSLGGKGSGSSRPSKRKDKDGKAECSNDVETCDEEGYPPCCVDETIVVTASRIGGGGGVGPSGGTPGIDIPSGPVFVPGGGGLGDDTPSKKCTDAKCQARLASSPTCTNLCFRMYGTPVMGVQAWVKGDGSNLCHGFCLCHGTRTDGKALSVVIRAPFRC